MRLWKLFTALIMALLCVSAMRLTSAVDVLLPNGPVGDQWKLVFGDEFDAPALDRNKWHTCYFWATDEEIDGCKIKDNDEMQWYQSDEVLVGGGMVRLQAQQRAMNGYQYTSGMISTHDKFTFRYGYAEARLRVPAGQGLWPAFWMMADDRGWPPEIDMLEVVGHTPNIAYFGMHYGIEGVNQGRSVSYWKGPDFSADFHTFAVDWQPGSIVWYVDGVEHFRETQNVADEPMYLILNLAVGGRWPGPPDSTTRFPATFDIDYVRVWQMDETSVPPSTQPPPAGPTMRVEVRPANANPGQTVNVALQLYNISNLYGLQATCQVDPAILTGANRLTEDVFGTDSYELDKGYQANGDWSVAATFLKPAQPFNGSGTAFTLQYRVDGAGSTAIDCTALAVDANGNPVAMGVVNNTFNTARPLVNNFSVEQPMTQPTAPSVQATALPTPDPIASSISGAVAYQKRPEQQGIQVRLFSGQNQLAELMSVADGTFAFTDVPNGSYTVMASAPGHLSLQTTVEVRDNQGASTGVIILPAGDMDSNGLIDLQDAALLGANYDLPVPPAPGQVDLDGDSLVSLVDLVLLGGNYGTDSRN